VSEQESEDALHAARAILGGQPLNISTDPLFSLLDARGFSIRGLRDARRALDAMQIGIAAEAAKESTHARKIVPLLHLARAIGPHLADRRPGWFRFLLALTTEKGESMFQLSFAQRPRSDAAQPRAVLDRATRTRQAVNAGLIAGSILSRIEAAKAKGKTLTVKAAIAKAINDEEITTEEEAALNTWHSFRKDCEKLTQGRGTYRLARYAGPIERCQGRWVALPDIGTGLPQLPPSKGGRPRS